MSKQKFPWSVWTEEKPIAEELSSKCSRKKSQSPIHNERRQLLALLASGAAAIIALGKAFAVDKLEKGDVDYRGHPKGRERCDNCRVWLPPNACKSVEGDISPAGWCNIWRPAIVSSAISQDPEDRLTKEDVIYRNTPKGKQRCDNCDVFIPPDACTSVEGKISPSGWCNIWRQAKAVH
jgi:hypothetical protein